MIGTGQSKNLCEMQSNRYYHRMKWANQIKFSAEGAWVQKALIMFFNGISTLMGYLMANSWL